MSLSTEERRALCEAWVSAAKARGAADRFKIIVHIGTNSLLESCELAKHAERQGVCAIALMPPFFFKPSSVDVIVRWCAAISQAAPALPLFYYHFPERTGVSISVEDLFNAARSSVPQLIGAKFTDFNAGDFARCARLQREKGSPYIMLSGREEMLLAGLTMKSQGSIGSAYNYLAPVAVRLVSLYQSGDLQGAQLEEDKLLTFAKIVQKYNPISAGKAIMKMVGMDVGGPRTPNERLSAEQQHELREQLNAAGFFEWTAPNKRH